MRAQRAVGAHFVADILHCEKPVGEGVADDGLDTHCGAR